MAGLPAARGEKTFAVADMIAIQPRFRGPPDSSNGGYACGLLAARLGGPAEVSLRRPPPLGRSLRVAGRDGGGAVLLDGDEVVAEAMPAAEALDLEVPAAVALDDARAASAAYPGLLDHPFPSCFGCGPDREPGDGLRVFPGHLPGRHVMAAPWTPDSSVAGERDVVRSEVLWAALDCPTGWAFHGYPGLDPEAVSLLARMTARVEAPVLAGQDHVVLAWPILVEGRKRVAGSAVVDADGNVRARARALWIQLAVGSGQLAEQGS
jgi:hypothetical protein